MNKPYSLYDSFSIEEAADIGKKFKVKCIGNGSGYEHALTEGKEYEITIETRILPMSPLCSFMGDNGKKGECHLHRFEKQESL